MNWYKIRQKALIPFLALSLFTLPTAASAAEATDNVVSSDMEILQEVLNYLDAYNIEGAERQQFLENAIRGMVYTLEDPYSDYFTEEELQDFEHGLNQEYIGIGVTLRYHNNNLYVTAVMAGSPASSAGIKQNDIITKVDGQAVTGLESVSLISGKEGSIVKLTIHRDNKTLIVPITRGQFSIPSVTSTMIPSTRIGYIAISSFSETSDQEFNREFDKLRNAGMKTVVIDLRDNLGGYVEASYNIAKRFIKNGTLMYVSDQSGDLQEVRITDGENIDMPVIILTNELTASASEILTAALHDNQVATVIGAQTYGKARIQSLFSLSNGGSLKLTIQRYLTPNKLDFNEIGLAPDIEVSSSSPASQLITGLYKAGLRNIEINASSSSFMINGINLEGQYIDVIQKGDKIYVPARILGSLLNSSVTWDAKNKKIVISDSNGKKNGFTIASKSAQIFEDQSYLELHDFQKKYTNLKWSYKKGILQLSNK